MNRKHLLILLIALLGLFSLIAAYSYRSVQERKKLVEEEQKFLAVQESLENPGLLMNKLFGKKLYKENCESCHIRKRHGHYNLDQIHEKLGNEYFSRFVMKEDSLLAISDAKTVFINDSYGGNIYVHRFTFSEIEMKQLMIYIRDTFRYR